MTRAAMATMSAGGRSVALTADAHSGLMLGTVTGWYGTPAPKVSLTERKAGHGAFPVRDDAVLYSARTVTIQVCADADSPEGLADAMDSVDALAGRVVTLEVTSGEQPTRATGYLSVEWDGGPMCTSNTGTLTIVCPDPRRYGLRHRMALSCGSLSGGGLQWTSGGAVSWPLDWGDVPASGVCTLTNAGNSTAYPTISVFGLSNPEVRTSEGGSLRLHGWVPWSTPLVLDCASETATISGVDVTSRLASRDFPRVDPGGSLTLTLSADGGSGHADVELLDTYI